MSGYQNGAVDEGPVEDRWFSGERFRLASRGDRYDGTHGTVRRVFASLDGREHAHVKHDDGTITTWPTARLERETASPAGGPVPGPDGTDEGTTATARAQVDLPPSARRAIADTLTYAARHLEQGDPACDCALHMAVAARAVVTDRAVCGVSSQAGLQALVHHQVPTTHSTPGGAADRAPAPPAGTNALVELDRAEDRAARAEAVDAVCEAAVRWYDADPDQPDGIAAEEALSAAVKALKEATDR